MAATGCQRENLPASQPGLVQGERSGKETGTRHQEHGESGRKPEMRHRRIQGGRDSHQQRPGGAGRLALGTVGENRRANRREGDRDIPQEVAGHTQPMTTRPALPGSNPRTNQTFN